MSHIPTIVVVDDDPDTVEFLCDSLRLLGFHAVSCRVGPPVAACIAEHAPSLVILDVEMGEVTGIDIFRALRADATTRQLPVVFFTGSPHRLQQEHPNYHDLGAALVIKPDIAGLQSRILDLLIQPA